MSKLLNLSVNVSKIDKSKLVKGKKGTYLNLTLSVNDEPDQYGNDLNCWISQTKEERENKEQRVFLGNGKIVWSDKKLKQQTAEIGTEDDLPF